MNRDEYGRFVKTKKEKSGAMDLAKGLGAGGIAGASFAAGAHTLGKTPGGRQIKKTASNILQDALEGGKKKASQLGRLIEKTAPKGLKGKMLKGGLAGLTAGGIAALMSKDEDEDDEENEA